MLITRMQPGARAGGGRGAAVCVRAAPSTHACLRESGRVRSAALLKSSANSLQGKAAFTRGCRLPGPAEERGW